MDNKTPTCPTLADALADALVRLRQAGIDNPAFDAHLLIAHALHMDRLHLITEHERPLFAHESAMIESLIIRRLAREPVARILGQREFWSLSFELNEATLEPRPDSETLIETTLKILKNQPQKKRRFLDLGTGTGCLLLSLLHEMPDATGLGIDRAPRAVAQAQKNAQRLNLSARSHFHVGDWLEGITERFDVIVSNPPYIKSADLNQLMPEVKNYDPKLALDGGNDGLGPYRHLIPTCAQHLEEHGFVVMEVGEGQAAEVATLFTQHTFTKVTITKDFGGIERCVVGFK